MKYPSIFYTRFLSLNSLKPEASLFRWTSSIFKRSECWRNASICSDLFILDFATMRSMLSNVSNMFLRDVQSPILFRFELVFVWFIYWTGSAVRKEVFSSVQAPQKCWFTASKVLQAHSTCKHMQTPHFLAHGFLFFGIVLSHSLCM